MQSAGLALEKGLPSNLDAERFVLGSILIDDSQFIQVAGILEADDFSLEKHRRIFHRMARSEEHTSELQSQSNLVCRLLLEKKKKNVTDLMFTHDVSIVLM